MPQISSEDLEHFEDAKLDSAFEERLLREGDNLRPVSNASQVISIIAAPEIISLPSTNGTASAKVKPKTSFQIPSFENESEPTEVLTLPENPTEEELWRFAENNPAVKRALRIFRGKIINVSKT